MKRRLLSAYEALASNNCSENKCRVKLDNSLVSYCGEELRDYVQKHDRASPSTICDCFIIGSPDYVSLVELKYYKGRNKYISVSKVRKQLSGGFDLLCTILHGTQKTGIMVQFVLCTNGRFQFPSQRLEFQKPILSGIGARINKICCGSKLPKNHKHIKIDHVMRHT
jgi:hypothetical protein